MLQTCMALVMSCWSVVYVKGLPARSCSLKIIHAAANGPLRASTVMRVCCMCRQVCHAAHRTSEEAVNDGAREQCWRRELLIQLQAELGVARPRGNDKSLLNRRVCRGVCAW